MENLKKIINKHNLKILIAKENNQNARRNCRDRERCPLNGNCMIDNVIYEPTNRNEDTNNDNDKRIY